MHERRMRVASLMGHILGIALAVLVFVISALDNRWLLGTALGITLYFVGRFVGISSMAVVHRIMDDLLLTTGSQAANDTSIASSSRMRDRGRRRIGIHDAIIAGDVPAVRELLEDNNELANARYKAGYLPLQVAWNRYLNCSFSSRYLDITKLLLDAGADVNLTNDDGFSILLSVTSQARVDGVHDVTNRPEYKEIVHLLFQAGADANIREKKIGGTPLLAALELGISWTASKLIEHGADVNTAHNDGTTPLHVASANGDTKLVEQLLAAGARVDSRNSGGGTPLHQAAFFGKPQCCRLLLSAGSDLGARTEDGRTPLDLARAQHHSQVVQILDEAAVR